MPPVSGSLGARWTPDRDDLVPDPLRDVGPGEITGDRAGNRPTFEAYDESTVLTSDAFGIDSGRVYVIDANGTRHEISTHVTEVTFTEDDEIPPNEQLIPLAGEWMYRFTVPIPDDAQLGFDTEPDWSSWQDRRARLSTYLRSLIVRPTPAPQDEELPRGS